MTEFRIVAGYWHRIS